MQHVSLSGNNVWSPEIVHLWQAVDAHVLPSVTKCTKTNGLKMYQDQFWANFRRGDSEKVSEPEADGRPFLAGVDGAPHRPPKYEPSC